MVTAIACRAGGESTSGAGTGLGLSTVYGIVAQAEGTITIQTQPGTGTTFTMLVPVTDEIATPIAEVARYQHTPTGETVLIVDDQDALREVTDRIFTRGGYHVITAADGPEAIRLAAVHDGDIHLLLTDVVMRAREDHSKSSRTLGCHSD
jgi:hypothetical protein